MFLQARRTAQAERKGPFCKNITVYLKKEQSD